MSKFFLIKKRKVYWQVIKNKSEENLFKECFCWEDKFFKRRFWMSKDYYSLKERRKGFCKSVKSKPINFVQFFKKLKAWKHPLMKLILVIKRYKFSKSFWVWIRILLWNHFGSKRQRFFLLLIPIWNSHMGQSWFGFIKWFNCACVSWRTVDSNWYINSGCPRRMTGRNHNDESLETRRMQ